MADGKASGDGWKPFVAMFAVDFAFAIVNVLLKKVLDEGMNHLVLIAYRQFIAALFLAPIAYFLERNSRPKLTFRIVCSLFVSGMLGSSLTQYFFLLGIQNTSATFACAFLNMVPIVTFIVALPFGLEELNLKSSSGKAKVLGSLICIGGVMVLTLYRGATLFNKSLPQSPSLTAAPSTSLSPRKRTERWVLSSMALVLGSILWSCWFLLQSNIAKVYPCQYSSTAIMSIFGAIQSASMASVSTGRNLSLWALRGGIQIGTVLFTGMVGSGLCYVGMSWCVKKRGPVFTAAFSPLVQVMAAIMGIPLVREQLHVGSVIGSALVILGLYILLWGKNREMKNKAQIIAQEAEQNKPLDEPKLQV